MLQFLAAAALGLTALLPANALASGTAETAVRNVLASWTSAFNAGRADEVCNLFSRELRYDYRGFPERGYDDICALLKRSLADTSRKYTYALEIKEVLVAGDFAVVRLIWRLTVGEAGRPQVTSVEPGMDVFARQPDGSWKIIRYIAYEE
jgi:uncharacterized protein (TIGR02246 family)